MVNTLITTEADFNVFCDQVRYWLDKFQLKDWCVYFHHKKLQRGQQNTNAECEYDAALKSVTFRLSTKLTTDLPMAEEIDACAKHETCHLLLADLQGTAYLTHAGSRQHFAGSFGEATVNRIVNVLNLIKPSTPSA